MEIRFILMVLIIFTSCDNSLPSRMDITPSNSDVNEIKAINLVKKFNKHVNKVNTKHSSATFFSDIIVDQTEKTTFKFAMQDILSVKNYSNIVSDTTSIDLYFIKFHTTDNSFGYSIVSADDRINKIYAYTECGLIQDTISNYPLARMLKSIPFILQKDLKKYYNNSNSKTKSAGSNDFSMIFGPLVSTHWSQCYPYNYRCPYYANLEGNMFLKGHAPAGCATIATAQVIAYYKKYKSKYDFDALTATPTINSNLPVTDKTVLEVSQFCHEIATDCHVKWTESAGSIDDPQKIADYLSDQNYIVSCYKDKNIDLKRLAENIKKGNPHITAGQRKKPRSGHIWIWDGVEISYIQGDIVTGVKEEVSMVHCNWGQGIMDPSFSSSDGWYSVDLMEQPDPEQQPYFDDNVQIYIENYK